MSQTAQCDKCKGYTSNSSRGKAWICDGCRQRFQGVQTTQRFRCDNCDFDLCFNCNNNKIQSSNNFQQQQQNSQLKCKKCQQGLYNCIKGSRWRCDNCRMDYKGISSCQRSRCDRCDFDICGRCYLSVYQQQNQQQNVNLYYQQQNQQMNQVQQQRQIFKGYCAMCPSQLQFSYKNTDWVCNNCFGRFYGNQSVGRFRCERDDFDLCSICVETPCFSKFKGQCGTCRNRLQYNNKNTSWCCNKCQRQFQGVSQILRYRCEAHDFDFCTNCAIENDNQFKMQQQQQPQSIVINSQMNQLNSQFASIQINQGNINMNVQFTDKNGNPVPYFQSEQYKQQQQQQQQQYNNQGVNNNQPQIPYQQPQQYPQQQYQQYPQQQQQYQQQYQQYPQQQQQQYGYNQNQQYQQQQNQNQQKEPAKVQVGQIDYVEGQNNQNLDKQVQNQQIQYQNITQQQIQQQQQNQQEKQEQKDQKVNDSQKSIENNTTTSSGNYDEKYTCKICLDKPSSYLNPNCGHLAICDVCVKDIKDKCPVCRKEGKFIKVFI